MAVPVSTQIRRHYDKVTDRSRHECASRVVDCSVGNAKEEERWALSVGRFGRFYPQSLLR